MSLKIMTEGFEINSFNILKEDLVNQITNILSTLNEAEMSPEDKWDSFILRQIRSKAAAAASDKRRALRWGPDELRVADKYNLSLPQRIDTWKGREITPLSDKDVDYTKGYGRNAVSRNLDREIGRSRVANRRDANLADFIRKRKERGPAEDREYTHFDPYATVDDTNAFGDTTFTHDNTGRFTQDDYDRKYGRGGSLSNRGWGKHSDLTDVEKDRVRVNKEMSQPVRDMKAALADRKSNQKSLDNVNLNYARNVADARKRFDDEMAYAEKRRREESEEGQKGVDDANSRINKLLKKESLDGPDAAERHKELYNGMLGYLVELISDSDELVNTLRNIGFTDDEIKSELDWLDNTSFVEALKEKLDSLNEAEMSDEDKHDTEILKNIYMKTQARANAALTPEEKDILKKYNLERVSWNKNVHSIKNTPAARVGDPLFSRRDFEKQWDSKKFGYGQPKADKINYADKARKRATRDEQKYHMIDRDFWDMPTPDYEAQHEKDEDSWLKPDVYQKEERKIDNQIMTQNVRDMKRALRDRKSGQAKVDSADTDLQAQIDKLKKEYEDRIAGVKKGHESRTEYARKEVQRNQDKIDKLLKREK